MIAIGLVIALAAFMLGRSESDPAAQGDGTASGSAGPALVAGSPREPVAAVARAVLPSVVQIETDRGLGSGVIYDRDGYILTAAHVVEDASTVIIRLGDGRRMQGEVVGSNGSTDVAVVHVEQGDLPAASLAVGSPVRVGQLAVAIGSPFGLEQTVTSGIVSAVNRTIVTNDGTSVTNMVQTDAPINPGNSGGALVDRQGRVIGINDAIRSSSGVNAGVGFAIPIDTAATVADALVEGRAPSFGFLGVGGDDPTSGDAGALITQVEPDTPASEAGLLTGDLVTSFDGEAIDSWLDLVGTVRATAPGTRVTLDVVRDGDQINIEIEVGRQ